MRPIVAFTVEAVAQRNVDPRGVRIPLPEGHWWPAAAMAAANARAERLKIRRPGYRSLVDELRKLGVEANDDSVRRCLTGEIVTWEIATPLSRLLGIRPPATISASPDEAALLDETAEELSGLLARLRGLGRSSDVASRLASHEDVRLDSDDNDDR